MARGSVLCGAVLRRLRWRRGGTGMSATLANLIWVGAMITVATAAGLLLGSTLLNGVFPAALQAFLAMFGS
ncbi:MAG: hypothetical protein K6T30_06260 [Alicyclobacillus sp.]|nr:hypothetical protein [Alicyclobacillus sp.]